MSEDRLLRASLFEIVLQSADLDGMTDFYARGFGYGFATDAEGCLGTALDRRLRLVPGTPGMVGAVCFAIADEAALMALAGRLENARTPHHFRTWPGMRGQAIEFADPDGNRFIFGVVGSADGTVEWTGVSALPARLQHVVFASRNAGDLIDFHERVVGFTLSDRVVDEQGGLRTAFLRCSHEHHSLAVFFAPEDRLDHHCFEAGDWSLIRDWADHFASQRVPLQWGPGRHGPGNNLFMFVHDPEGNWLELSAELEQIGPGRVVGEWQHEERTLNSWGMAHLRS